MATTVVDDRQIVCGQEHRLRHGGAPASIAVTATAATTDTDGMRVTCFATNTRNTPTPALEPRHRQRARAEDRIRAARTTGPRNLPLHDMARNEIWNEIWLEIDQIALDPLAWMPMLALTGKPCLWEPRRLHLRLFATGVMARLEALPNPG